MFTAIIGFLFGLVVGLAAQESRRPQSRISRHLALGVAIVLTLAFFGYTVGKDLANHDKNATKTSSVLTPVADRIA